MDISFSPYYSVPIIIYVWKSIIHTLWISQWFFALFFASFLLFWFLLLLFYVRNACSHSTHISMRYPLSNLVHLAQSISISHISRMAKLEWTEGKRMKIFPKNSEIWCLFASLKSVIHHKKKCERDRNFLEEFNAIMKCVFSTCHTVRWTVILHSSEDWFVDDDYVIYYWIWVHFYFHR